MQKDAGFAEDLNRTEIERRQLERLKVLVSRVRQSNVFQQARLASFIGHGGTSGVDSLDDLSRVPFTTKADLVADQLSVPPYGTNLTFNRQAYSRLHQTSGTTTGTPMRWLDTPQSWQWFMECWSQILRIVGLKEDDRLAFPFSFGPFVGFWAAFEGANRLGNLCLAGGGMTSSQRLRLIEDNQATVVCCTPTYALRLAEVAADDGNDLTGNSVRMLIVAGEPGGSLPTVRSRIEEAWGARVYDHWGMTEIGSLGVECVENPGGIHILETECIVEVIEAATGNAAVADEKGVRHGELVITNLGRIGSPLIRYRTGDLVEADCRRCPCGRELVRLNGGVLGRSDDMITIRGNNVVPSSVEALVREFREIVEFRIEIRTKRSMHHMLVQIEAASDQSVGVTEALPDRVSARIRERLGFSADVELVPQGSLPRFELKGRRFFRVSDDT